MLFLFRLQLRSAGQLFTKRICYAMLSLVLSQKTHIIGAHSHSSFNTAQVGGLNTIAEGSYGKADTPEFLKSRRRRRRSEMTSAGECLYARILYSKIKYK